MDYISADSILLKVKRIQGKPGIDTQEDEALLEIIKDVIKHFKVYVGLPVDAKVEDTWDFIITDVAIKQYNRRGSEGMKSESVDGYSVSYDESIDDFAKFSALLRGAFDLPSEGVARKGRMWYY